MTIRARIDAAARVGRSASAYTLFEILLALGIIAILLGVAVPMISGSFDEGVSEAVVEAIGKTTQAAHASAVETGEARRLGIVERGLIGGAGAIPSTELPEGWKLQVMRFTENRFRKPERDEFWEFNGAGICEPLTLRLVNGRDAVVLKFDPLTALILPEND
jgi:hypothetical protein